MGIYVGDKRYGLYVGDTRRKVMTEKALPYDAEIEYLQGDGNQFIDTNIFPTSTLITELTFSVTSAFTFGIGAFAFGAYDDNKTSYSAAINSSTTIRVPNGTAFTNFAVPNIGTSQHTLSYCFGNILFDGSRKSTMKGIIDTSVSIRIFTRHFISGKQPAPANGLRIHSCKFTDNNTILHDFIPVRVGQIGYMYDKISGQLFGNEGTGDFILGNDKN